MSHVTVYYPHPLVQTLYAPAQSKGRRVHLILSCSLHSQEAWQVGWSSSSIWWTRGDSIQLVSNAHLSHDQWAILTQPPLEPLSKTNQDTLLSVACKGGQVSVIDYLVNEEGCDAFGELHICRSYCSRVRNNSWPLAIFRPIWVNGHTILNMLGHNLPTVCISHHFDKPNGHPNLNPYFWLCCSVRVRCWWWNMILINHVVVTTM